MSKLDETASFYPANKQEWRDWLEKNHINEDAIWLIINKKSSKRPNVSWPEAVEEALCFGWIDSTKQPIDRIKYQQYFTKRKPDSGWSKINKEKIEELNEKGLMFEAGLKSVEIAKENGSWTAYDSVEALIVPDDLSAAFDQYGSAFNYYNGLKKSAKKQLLHWVAAAKKPETRQQRIDEIAQNASFHRLPEHFQ